MNEGFTWPYPAVATGIGSMPGIDSREATNIVVGEFGAVPHVVELPSRGPGGDPVGRTAAMLAGVDRTFEVETTVRGWRLGHTGQAALRRARAWLSEDLDSFEEYAASHQGPVKVHMLGPWSTAARIEDAAGESLIRDHGAVAEISGAAVEAASELTARVQRAVPDGQVIVHIEEPELSRVLDGRVPMSSGRLFHRAVEPAVVQAHLSIIVNAVVAANAVACVRCAAPGAPVELMLGTGARIIGIDIEQPMRSASAHESLLGAWESGVGLLLSCVPAQIDVSRSDTGVSAPLRRLMERAGFAQVPSNVAISPTSGLAHLSPEGARTVMDACTRVGVVVRDEHSEPVHG